MSNKVLNISYEVISRDELSEVEQQMEQLALEAASTAYVPYSHFQVGAAVLLANGEIIATSNQENAAYPSGICAERNAIFYAGSKYPDVPIVSLLLVANNKLGRLPFISPCGACRQVIMEASVRTGAFKFIIAGRDEIVVLDDARKLLPFGFDGSDL